MSIAIFRTIIYLNTTDGRLAFMFTDELKRIFPEFIPLFRGGIFSVQNN